MYDVMGDSQGGRKFDSQKIQPANGPSCRANTAQWVKADNTDVIDTNSNVSYYLRSRTNRVPDKRAGQV